MKRIFQSSIFRAVCAIIIGGLLIKYPDNTVIWLTVAIGILFLLSGLIALIVYLNAKKHVTEYKVTDQNGNVVAGEQPTFPIVGMGSLLLGLILALTPNVFIDALMYIIGAILILGAINQYMNLVNARKYGKIGFGYWVFPSVVLLVGAYVIIKPMAPMSMAMLILGWCLLLYGVTEAVNSLKIYSCRKQAEQAQAVQEASVAEEVQEPTSSENPETLENPDKPESTENKEEEYPDFIG